MTTDFRVRTSGRFIATIGFDEFELPREVFLSTGKPGSGLDAVLGGVALALSVGLQCGVSPIAMAVSVGRAGSPPAAISVVGAALNLLAEYERAL